MPNFLSLLWRLFCDSRVPISPKLLLIGAVLYFLSPYDLLPDFFVPILGFAEDIVILMLTLKYFVRVSPKEVVWEHVKQIEKEQRLKRKM